MTLATDGFIHSAGNTGSSRTATLTTTQANDYIMVCISANGGPVTSVSGSSMGSFSLVSRIQRINDSNQWHEIWAKFSTVAVTSEVITVSFTTGNLAITIDAFGVSGSNQTSLVWNGTPATSGVDGNSSLLFTPGSTASTMVLFSGSTDSGPDPSPGTGFTDISSIDWMLTEYKLTTSTLTIACNGAGGVSFNRAIAVAIPDAGGGGGGGTFMAKQLKKNYAVKRAAYW